MSPKLLLGSRQDSTEFKTYKIHEFIKTLFFIAHKIKYAHNVLF